MADNSSFLRTVTFGGYDKADVEKRLNYLYSQLYELKNDLRESKLALDEYKKGSDEEKVHESVLSAERANLSNTQTQKEQLNQKVKETREELNRANDEISNLKAKVLELTEELDKANSSLKAFQAGKDPAAISRVFVEAQKSADAIVEDAKTEAEKLEKNSKALAEKMVTDANDSAAEIIYNAEKQAAEIEAKAANESEQMKVASQNLKAVMLSDIKSIGTELSRVKELFESIEKNTAGKLSESEALLKSTEDKICSGGVPVFSEPKVIEPNMPKKPETSSKKKTNSDLEKLMNMADSLEDDEDKPAEPKKEKLGLDDIMQKAEALDGASPKSDKDDKDKKDAPKEKPSKNSKAADLKAIMEQAKSLDN